MSVETPSTVRLFTFTLPICKLHGEKIWSELANVRLVILHKQRIFTTSSTPIDFLLIISLQIELMVVASVMPSNLPSY